MQKYYVTVDGFGNIRWYKDAKYRGLHREGAPAIEWADGSKSWYQNDNLHREDGPALEYADGSKEWWQKGKLHRTDGPAYETADGDKYWYLEGTRYSEAAWKKRLAAPAKELTVAEIEKLLGYKVKVVK